jgi:hypothetical protein
LQQRLDLALDENFPDHILRPNLRGDRLVGVAQLGKLGAETEPQLL